MSEPPYGPIEDRDYYWPQPQKYRPTWTLAIWRDHSIVTEHGEMIDVWDYADTKKAIAANKLLLFLSDIGMWEYKDSAIADPDAEVSADEGGFGSNIFLTIKRKHYHIMGASAWGIPCSIEGIRALRRLFTIGGCGDYPSAGGWGQAQMRLYYPFSASRIANLARRYWDIFKDNMVGGRVDVVKLGQRFATAYEYDQNGAYAHAMLRVPAGTVAWWDAAADGTPEPACATAYLNCHATIPGDLTLSPLPRRGDDGIVHYDRQEGESFDGWYWLEEVQIARAAGVTVEVKHGLCWSDTDGRFERWVQVMDMLRRKTAGDPDVSGLIKRATVSAIGRFAQSWDVSTVTTEPVEGDEPLTDPNTGPMNPWYIHREERARPGLLPHLFSHASMVCRLETYLVAKAAMEVGTLIGTNYDAVFTTAPLPMPLGDGLGEWKSRSLTGPAFPNRRQVVAEELVRLPGLTGENRERAIREARGE